MIATRPARAAVGGSGAAATTRPGHRPAGRLAVTLALALLTPLVAFGCSAPDGSIADRAPVEAGAGSDDDSTGEQGGAPDSGNRQDSGSGDSEESDAAEGPGGGSADESENRSRPSVRQRAIIRTGTISVTTEQPERAADRAEDLVSGTDGYVAERTTEHPDDDLPDAATTVRLELRVPVDRFDAARERISELGEVTEDRHEATDVTDELVDVESRISNQERSIARLRKLMSSAEEVGDVVRIESELQSREADLESLQARQQALSDQTSLSTLTATFAGPTPEDAESDDGPLGFLTGLRSGTDALLATGAVALTILGAVAPFLAVLLPIGVPAAWLFLRWRRRRAVPGTASEPTPATTPRPEG